MRNGKIYRYDDPFWSTFYRPNLDLYPEKLAHQFAKAEMSGEEFKYDFNRLEKAVTEIKQQINQVGKKLTADQMLQVRNNLTKNIKFAAGILNAETKALLKIERGTVWLSDDTLIKQINSRDGQAFGLAEYELLPDIIQQPDNIIKDNNSFQLYKNINGKKFVVVIKILQKEKEIFMTSFRLVSEKQWKQIQ